MNIVRKEYLKFIVLVGLLVIITINILMVWRSWDKLLDFGSFVAAGQFAAAGQNPYSDDSPLIFRVFFPKAGVGGSMPNLNPPIVVPVFQSLADRNPFVLATIWRMVAIGLYLASLIIFFKTYENFTPVRIIWAFSLSGFWHTIELGQIYTLLVLFVALAFYFSSKKLPLLSGIFIGLIAAIKPNFGLWILFIFAARDWHTAITATLIFISISLLPLPWYGLSIYQQWLSASNLTASTLGMPGNSSLMGLMSRFGNPEFGAILAVVLVFYGLIWVWRMRPSLHRAHKIGILISLLASPIAWAGYIPLLLPLFLSRKKWNIPFYAAATIFSVPFVFPLAFFDDSPVEFVFWGGLYGWGLLLCAYDLFSVKAYSDTNTPGVTRNAVMTNNIQTN